VNIQAWGVFPVQPAPFNKEVHQIFSALQAHKVNKNNKAAKFTSLLSRFTSGAKGPEFHENHEKVVCFCSLPQVPSVASFCHNAGATAQRNV
jgi:hypothetical protein